MTIKFFCFWNVDLTLSIKSWNIKFWYFISNNILLNFSFEIRAVLFLTSFPALYNIIKSSLYLNKNQFRQQLHAPYFLLIDVFFSYLRFRVSQNQKPRKLRSGYGIGQARQFAPLNDACRSRQIFQCWSKWSHKIWWTLWYS